MLGLFLVQLVTKFPLFEPIHAHGAHHASGRVYLVLAAVDHLRGTARAVPPLMRDGLRAPVRRARRQR